VLEALSQCFQYGQAVDNPLAFSAAAELLITAFTAPHPSLLVLLMTGSSVDKAKPGLITPGHCSRTGARCKAV